MKNKITKEIVATTIKLMNYYTIKDNYKEFYNAHKFIKNFLPNHLIKEYIINNYPNIVLTNTQSKDLDIIFCAHLDVVPLEDNTIKETPSKLYGRGAIDMKGQLAVILSLLKHTQTSKKIAFIITSDEEIGGACCKEILKDYTSKLAVVPDASKDFALVIEEKGLLQIKLSIEGKSYHASEPTKGENAIVKLMDIYNSLLKYYPLPQNNEFKTTINLSKLHGGTTINMVPDYAEMTLDIRFTKEDTISNILATIKKISPKVEIEILDQGPIFQVDEHHPLIEKFISDATTVLKEPIKIEKCVATSDAIYFSEKDIPTILMNPKGANWHGKDEYVEKDSLYTLYKIFETLL